MIRTAFRLPFRAVHPAEGFFSGGEEVQLSLEFAADPTPTQVALADGLMRLFADFAATGALSGQRFAPHRSGVDVGLIEMRSSSVRVYSLGHCRIDDAAMVLLCDMLLRESVALSLRSFIVSNGGQGVDLLQDPNSWSTYPARYTPLPFEVDDQEPESGAYTFVLDLAEPLKSAASSTLTAWLGLWTRCVMAGGYALAPISPKDNYVEPDDSIVDFATTVEWSVFKLRAHPAAIDALVNLLACFSQEVQRVLRLAIQ
jgi:hypothetical protein